MAVLAGTKNIEIIADFAVDLAVQINKTLADGKVTLGEGLAFLPIGLKIPEVLRAVPQSIAEIKDLDYLESRLLIEHIADRLRTEDLQVAEEVATEGLKALVALQNLGKAVKKVVKK